MPMLKIIRYAGLFLSSLIAVNALAALAQEGADIVVAVPPTEVVLNWGDFVAIFLANIADPQSTAWTAFGLALTWLVLKLPAPLQWAFRVFQVEQLIKNSINAGINSTKGAVQGQTLNVNVGSSVFAKALQYAADNGSKKLIEWMGGRQGIEQKIIARLPLQETVSGPELVDKAKALPSADKKVT